MCLVNDNEMKVEMHRDVLKNSVLYVDPLGLWPLLPLIIKHAQCVAVPG